MFTFVKNIKKGLNGRSCGRKSPNVSAGKDRMICKGLYMGSRAVVSCDY